MHAYILSILHSRFTAAFPFFVNKRFFFSPHHSPLAVLLPTALLSAILPPLLRTAITSFLLVFFFLCYSSADYPPPPSICLPRTTSTCSLLFLFTGLPQLASQLCLHHAHTARAFFALNPSFSFFFVLCDCLQAVLLHMSLCYPRSYLMDKCLCTSPLLTHLTKLCLTISLSSSTQFRKEEDEEEELFLVFASLLSFLFCFCVEKTLVRGSFLTVSEEC